MSPLSLMLALVLAPVDATPESVQRMIDRGAMSEASVALERASLPPGVHARFEGQIAMAQGRREVARRAFERALAETPGDTTLRLYLARVQLELGDADAVLTTLIGTEAIAGSVLAQPLLHARALGELGRDVEAYRVLADAANAFPGEPAPRLELVVLAARHGLYAAARAWAESRLAIPSPVDETMAMAIVVALHRDFAALPLLERIAAMHPTSAKLRAALATAYAQHGHAATAGRRFHEATMMGGDYAQAAADQFRLAGDTARALAMNASVKDPTAQIQQRLHILFEAEDYARVVALAAPLAALGADVPAERYRVAYAYFALGQPAHAARWARTLAGTPEAARARSLLSAMGRMP